MKKLSVLLCVLMLSCSPSKETVSIVNGNDGTNGTDGSNGLDGVDGKDGTNCSVIEHEEGVMLLCGDGTELLVRHGTNGLDGIDGLNGLDGLDGINGENGTDGLDGQDGLDGTNGLDGTDGVDGKDGKDGINGTDGSGAILTTYNLGSGCTAITGSSLYAKKNGSTIGFYSSSLCSSHKKVFEMTEGDSMWVSSDMLAVYLDDGFRVVTF
jgi:hypothetical protein